MRHSKRVGFSFGLTSGVITTLGLMVGLYSSTQSKLAVIGGILTIAIADAFSDALGIHISEEFEDKYRAEQIWEATFMTFFSKFLFAMLFAIPVLLLPLKLAVISGVIMGLTIIGVFSLKMNHKRKAWKRVLEHMSIAVVVIIITYFVGALVNRFFI